jgi:hypothetical protein
MIYYRLLRDNKESGPYSETDMIAGGFKPYDLLWAEGRSAGWQYPSEIPAFRQYAPIIEEQPFDRFYKKKPTQTILATDEPVQVSRSFSQPVSIVEHGPVTVPGQRHIHVTLPSGNTFNLTRVMSARDTANDSSSGEEGRKKITAPAAFARPLLAEEPSGVKHPPQVHRGFLSGISTELPAPLPSAAGDDSGRQVDRPASPAAAFSWTMILGAVTGIATLVGLGIMIGLALNRDKAGTAYQQGMRKAGQPVQQPARLHDAVSPSVATVTVPPAASRVQKPVPEKIVTSKIQPPVAKRSSAAASPIAAATSSDNGTVNNTHSDQERMVQRRDDAVLPVRSVAHPAVPATLHVEKNLQLSLNDFKTGAFGGISNLRCTLSNTSAYTLESVTVEVNYIQANNKTFKSEAVIFKNVPAGGQLTIDAPSSPRGVKIAAKVIKIEPREPLPNTTAKS